MANHRVIQLHPLVEGNFIATINVNEPIKDQSELETVIIFDQTNLPQNAVERVSNEIIPLFLAVLDYESDQIIHYISYDSRFLLYSMTKDYMKSRPLKVQGRTKNSIYKMCLKIFRSFDQNRSARMLMICSSEKLIQSENESFEKFEKICKQRNFNINSQAVRLLTLENQPDPTAAWNFLGINNVATPNLIDISLYDSSERNARKIAELFRGDFATSKLKVEENIFMKFPWDNPTNCLKFQPGKNIFWIKEIDSNLLELADDSFTFAMQQPLTWRKFCSLMTSKIDCIVNNAKILKILGTEISSRKLSKMIEDFESIENILTTKTSSIDFYLEKLLQIKICSVLAKIREQKNVDGFSNHEKLQFFRRKEETENFLITLINCIENVFLSL